MNSLQTKTGKRGNADDMFYEPLTRQVMHYKETGEGQRKMSRAIEELLEKRAEEMARKMAEEQTEKMTPKASGMGAEISD